MATLTAVISKNGTVLDPTFDIRRVRRKIDNGTAHIICHDPFAIQLTYDPEGISTQETEVSVDTGYLHAGISVKAEKHEYLSEERKLLPDEKKRHMAQKRYRSTRRNRLRYRKPQTKRKKCSRKKQPGWIAPSLLHKADAQVERVLRYCKYFPVTLITLEVGQFDTAVLSAVSKGEPVPEGIDYQHGPKYGYDTLREAVFARDHYTCQVCSKSAIKDGRILEVHHIGFRKGDCSNRIGNLLTVCTHCHTPSNHKPGGKLWDRKPKGDLLPQASFMNTVKWCIYNRVLETGIETHLTYGTVTKRTRKDHNIAKSHANDAYCIGKFFPKHRSRTRYYKKRRRNDRCIERFYDAKYIDTRDGEIRKAADLGCNRKKRKYPRNNPGNLRPLRGKKVKAGYRSIRIQRHCFQAGDIVLYEGKRHVVKTTRTKFNKARGWYETVEFTDSTKQITADEVTILRYVKAWQEVPQ